MAEKKTTSHAFASKSFYPGPDLFSRGPTSRVSSALVGLTTVFGMGTGVTPPLEGPRVSFYRNRSALAILRANVWPLGLDTQKPSDGGRADARRQMVNEEDEAKFRCEIAPIAVGPTSAGALRSRVSMARMDAGN